MYPHFKNYYVWVEVLPVDTRLSHGIRRKVFQGRRPGDGGRQGLFQWEPAPGCPRSHLHSSLHGKSSTEPSPGENQGRCSQFLFPVRAEPLVSAHSLQAPTAAPPTHPAARVPPLGENAVSPAHRARDRERFLVPLGLYHLGQGQELFQNNQSTSQTFAGFSGSTHFLD